jgi:hypothetical protein
VYKLVYSGTTRINQTDAEEAEKKNTSNSGNACKHQPPVDVDTERYKTPVVPEEFCILRCETVQFGRNLPTFRWNVHSPPSHVVLLTRNAKTTEDLQIFLVAEGVMDLLVILLSTKFVACLQLSACVSVLSHTVTVASHCSV